VTRAAETEIYRYPEGELSRLLGDPYTSRFLLARTKFTVRSSFPARVVDGRRLDLYTSRARQQAAATQGASKLAHSKCGLVECGSLLPPWFGEACFASAFWSV
jgi:hypothetical protein